MKKRAIEKEQKKLLSVTKDSKLQMRLSQALKVRYEKALQLEGISITDHLTDKIIEFCVNAEAARRKALTKK